jgi:hypothetical protein
MTKPQTCFLLVALLYSGYSSSAFAGVVVTFDQPDLVVDLTQTSSFTLEVQIAADADTQGFAGYNTTIDLASMSGNVGASLPTGWTVTDITPIFAFPAGNFFQSELPGATTGDYDLAGGGLSSFDGSGEVQLSTTPLSLFSFTVALDGTAEPGEYTASFAAEDRRYQFFNDATGQFAAIESVVDSQVATITVVPEPSGMALLASTALVLLGGRRGRKA